MNFYILLDGTRIIDFHNCETSQTTKSYILMTSGYKDDLLCGYYRYIDGAIVRDEALYAEYLAKIEETDELVTPKE